MTAPSGLSAGQQRWVSVGQWMMLLLAHGGTILMAVGAILLAFGPADQGPAFMLGVACSAVGVVWEIFKARRFARLERARRTSLLRMRERSQSLNTILQHAVRVMMDVLQVDFSTARVSVYRHRDSSFFLLARVSESQTLEKTGRRRYPESEGVIGNTWDLGRKVVTGLPADRAAWEKECVDTYCMQPSEVPALTMHARSIVGVRIDAEGTSPAPLGIVIIESLKSRGVNGKTLEDLTGSPLYPLFRPILVEVSQCLDETDVADFRATNS